VRLLGLGVSPPDMFLVEIPALAMRFIAFYQGNDLMLAATKRVPRRDEEIGVPVRAKEMFVTAQRIAWDYNDLPM
jgi:hypothetical protein